jgi:hypothetical protein
VFSGAHGVFYMLDGWDGNCFALLWSGGMGALVECGVRGKGKGIEMMDGYDTIAMLATISSGVGMG